MLTDAEISTVRRNAARSHIGRTFTVPVARIRYVDGPLAGVESILEQSALRCPIIGWCQTTPTGPIQLIYVRGESPSEYRFRSLEGGPT